MKKNIIAATFILFAAITMAFAPVKSFAKEITPEETELVQIETQNSVASGITGDKALEIAMKDAGYDKEDALYTKVTRTRDGGMAVYKVEFRVGFVEHFYEISIVDGEILDVIVND